MNKLHNIGHRGAMGHAPENTMASIKKAVELEVDMIEFDVYEIDRQLVVIHDDRVDRTTNSEGYVWDYTFEELRKLDAGNKQQIPTLEELVTIIPQHIKINIELKGRTATESVVKFIQARCNNKIEKQRYLVSSFIHQELKKTRKLDKEIPLGALCCAEPIKLAKFAENLNAYSVNPSMEFVTKEFVKDAHMRGLKVYPYTVNHPADIQRLHEMGVDGVFCNYPERVTTYNESISIWL